MASTAPQIDKIVEIARQAGREILAVYNAEGGIEVEHKDDNSPLTEADQRAHNVIVEQLAQLEPRLPILSEESASIAFAERSQWQRYWLVDPLDGTKEFIKRNGEFTVNIALIEDGHPIQGVVHVPVSGITYTGDVSEGATLMPANGASRRISVSTMPQAGLARVVASRSHADDKLQGVIDAIEATVGEVEVVSMGSSLKICLVAEGKADFYPRLAPTSEWDTAAAHAVLAAAGGSIVDTNFQPLRYNQKDSILNPFFLAIADQQFDWQTLLADRL